MTKPTPEQDFQENCDMVEQIMRDTAATPTPAQIEAAATPEGPLPAIVSRASADLSTLDSDRPYGC